MEDLSRAIADDKKLHNSGTESSDVGSFSAQWIETVPGIDKINNALSQTDSNMVGLSPSIAGQSEYHMDLEDSLDEHSEEMSVFSPSLESSMTHKHILRHKNLPDTLNPDSKQIVPKRQSLTLPDVPEIEIVESDSSNEDRTSMDTPSTAEVNEPSDDVNEDNFEVEEDKKFLFETASMLLKAPDLSQNLSPLGIIRKQRSYSESAIKSEVEPSSDQPKIFLTKKTKKLVIKLPNGDLLKGRCKID